MKIRAADVARELGLSKATVSLALNDKPGVSQRTKKKIYECIERMTNGEGASVDANEKKGTIKVVSVSKNLNISFGSELDFRTPQIEAFAREANKDGFSFGITYANMYEDDIEQVVEECNQNTVSGVILYATELLDEDYELFKNIRKPMVIYDSDIKNVRHHCVLANNQQGVKAAVEYLLEKKHKNILYLANDKDIYNFRERRIGFHETLIRHNLNYNHDQMIPIGTSIDSVYARMKEYICNHNLPDAFIMENYQVSIGVTRALREKKISIPKDVSLIGIDEISDYLTSDYRLTAVKVPRTERALIVMILLKNEIENESSFKSKVFTECPLIEGDSVKSS